MKEVIVTSPGKNFETKRVTKTCSSFEYESGSNGKQNKFKYTGVGNVSSSIKIKKSGGNIDIYPNSYIQN